MQNSREKSLSPGLESCSGHTAYHIFEVAWARAVQPQVSVCSAEEVEYSAQQTARGKSGRLEMNVPQSPLEVGVAVSVAANAWQLLIGECFARHKVEFCTFKVSLQNCISEHVTELSCYKYLNSNLLIFVTCNVD